jgi:hypothetical protein
VPLACEFLARNNLQRRWVDRETFPDQAEFQIIFFVRSAEKPCLARVSLKRTLQNLVFKELKYQNLDNRRLRDATFGLFQLSRPRSLSRNFELWGKVRCHSEGVENGGDSNLHRLSRPRLQPGTPGPPDGRGRPSQHEL